MLHGRVGGSSSNRVAPGPLPAPLSLSARLTLALVAVSIFTLVAVGVLFYGFIGRYVLQREQRSLLANAVKVASQIESLTSEGPGLVGAGRPLQLLLRVDLQVLPSGAAILVYKGGELAAVAGPANALLDQYTALYPRALALTADGPASQIVDVQSLNTTLVLAAARFSFGNELGLVFITLPVGDAVASRRGLIGVLLVSGGLAVLLAVLVGFGVGAWTARPLRRLSRAARNMAAGNYSEPVTGHYPGEVFELAQSMEAMRREVKRSEESLRGFVASAAHELRTPLTSIAGFAQALLDGTASSEEEQRRSAAAIHRESTRLRHLVDTLLVLSRYDSGQFRPTLAAVDVGALVEEEIRLLEDAGLVEPGRIARVVEPGSIAWTDSLMLRQAVANLLKNAVQYGGNDPIGVEIRHAEDTKVILDVWNGGVPIPPDEREHIFDRFYRGRASARTEGFGLGLPLVKEICSVLGAEVRLLEHPDRTVFRLTLPGASPELGHG